MRLLTLRERVTLGNVIRRIRYRRRYTQALLGEMLGVFQPQVSEWEGGLTIPSALLLTRLAEIGTDQDAKILLAIRDKAQLRGSTVKARSAIAIALHSNSLAPTGEARNVQS